MAVYADQLRALLEPEGNGQIVAIHLPTQEYFLGRTLLEAADQLRQKHPDARRGETYARAVGSRAATIRARSLAGHRLELDDQQAEVRLAPL